jgi:hypothetical protein
MMATQSFARQSTDPTFDRLTHVELTWLAKRVEHRVRKAA